jgi:xylulokinase
VLGSAILAGHAVGVYDDLAETAKRFVKETSRVEPSSEKQAVYRSLVKEYIRLMEEAQPIFDSLAAINE